MGSPRMSVLKLSKNLTNNLVIPETYDVS